VKLYVTNPMPFDGVGPSQTCLNICRGLAGRGAEVELFVTRRKVASPPGLTLHVPGLNLGAHLPYRAVAPALRSAATAKILRRVPEGSAVYVWPATPQSVVRALKARGCFIVAETINLHTEVEKAILEQEMEAEGFRYEHYVTQDKIERQREVNGLADLIFCANAAVRQSLIDTGAPEARIALTRYASSASRERKTYETDRPRFLFVGRVCFEKGVHRLLRGWRRAGIDGELVLCGSVDPRFRAQYADLLELPGVRLKGFCPDIGAEYARADAFIFLSLAEGGPQATLEAAAHGLPMIVSAMGAGRLSEFEGAAAIVDEKDEDDVAAALVRLAASAEERATLGRSAFAASRAFTWRQAARERREAIAQRYRPTEGAASRLTPEEERAIWDRMRRAWVSGRFRGSIEDWDHEFAQRWLQAQDRKRRALQGKAQPRSGRH
jgi:glycosyltransferase involved in cell wall biosynthesis